MILSILAASCHVSRSLRLQKQILTTFVRLEANPFSAASPAIFQFTVRLVSASVVFLRAESLSYLRTQSASLFVPCAVSSLRRPATQIVML